MNSLPAHLVAIKTAAPALELHLQFLCSLPLRMSLARFLPKQKNFVLRRLPFVRCLFEVPKTLVLRCLYALVLILFTIKQVRALQRGCDVLVSTSGRLMDFLEVISNDNHV
jgi:hypothetical protein